MLNRDNMSVISTYGALWFNPMRNASVVRAVVRPVRFLAQLARRISPAGIPAAFLLATLGPPSGGAACSAKDVAGGRAALSPKNGARQLAPSGTAVTFAHAITLLRADRFRRRQRGIHDVERMLTSESCELLRLETPANQATIKNLLDFQIDLNRWALDLSHDIGSRRARLVAWASHPRAVRLLAAAFSHNWKRRAAAARAAAQRQDALGRWVLEKLLADPRAAVYLSAIKQFAKHKPNGMMTRMLWDRAVRADCLPQLPRPYSLLRTPEPNGGVWVERINDWPTARFRGKPVIFKSQFFSGAPRGAAAEACNVLLRWRPRRASSAMAAYLRSQLTKLPLAFSIVLGDANDTHPQNLIKLFNICHRRRMVPYLLGILERGGGFGNAFNQRPGHPAYYNERIVPIYMLIIAAGKNPAAFHFRTSKACNGLPVLATEAQELADEAKIVHYWIAKGVRIPHLHHNVKYDIFPALPPPPLPRHGRRRMTALESFHEENKIAKLAAAQRSPADIRAAEVKMKTIFCQQVDWLLAHWPNTLRVALPPVFASDGAAARWAARELGRPAIQRREDLRWAGFRHNLRLIAGAFTWNLQTRLLALRAISKLPGKAADHLLQISLHARSQPVAVTAMSGLWRRRPSRNAVDYLWHRIMSEAMYFLRPQKIERPGKAISGDVTGPRQRAFWVATTLACATDLLIHWRPPRVGALIARTAEKIERTPVPCTIVTFQASGFAGPYFSKIVAACRKEAVAPLLAAINGRPMAADPWHFDGKSGYADSRTAPLFLLVVAAGKKPKNYGFFAAKKTDFTYAQAINKSAENAGIVKITKYWKAHGYINAPQHATARAAPPR